MSEIRSYQDVRPERRAEIERWNRVHIEADRRPWMKLFPRLGRYSGEGTRYERGGFKG